MYKIAFVDLDGTLFPFGSFDISDQTIESINNIKNNDVIFVVNTGRPFKGIPENAKKYSDYVISSNGSMISDINKNEIIKKVCLNTELVEKIYHYAKDNNFIVMFYIDGDRYFEYGNIDLDIVEGRSKQHIKDIKNNSGIGVDDLLAEVKNKNLEVGKIMLFLDNSKQEKTKEEIRKFSSGINVVHSGANNVEVTDKNANKGLAIDWLTKKLGITKDEIIVCGDNDNDSAMFDYADTIIVPSDGADVAKNRATIISESPLVNGVARKIEEIIK